MGGADCKRRRPGEGAGGGTPPTQLGGMGERCKLPHGGAPESSAFCVGKLSKTTQIQHLYSPCAAHARARN